MTRTAARYHGLMECEECRGADGDGDLSDASRVEEERPNPTEEPVTQRQAGRPPATTTKHDELVLQQEILRDHRAYATGATEFAATTARWSRVSRMYFMCESA